MQTVEASRYSKPRRSLRDTTGEGARGRRRCRKTHQKTHRGGREGRRGNREGGEFRENPLDTGCT